MEERITEERVMEKRVMEKRVMEERLGGNSEFVNCRYSKKYIVINLR